jgi:hypothetical protein
VAGRRIFVAGEILTAANVQSFLQDQVCMVFDDSTARGSAIPSPVEGMLTYLKDTDNVEKFNGSAFVPVGGLVATKTALKTDIFSASVTSGNNVAVTDLSITHTMQNANNKLLIMAFFGVAANSQGFGSTGIAVADDGTLIGIGDTAGSRTRTAAGGLVSASSQTFIITMPHVHLLYSPGDTLSHTYTVRAINLDSNTRTVFVNRGELDTDVVARQRGASAITIQEVAV